LDSELLSNYYCGCQLHYQELDCVDGQFDEDREQDRGENFLDDWRDISFDNLNLRIHTNWYATHAGTIVSAMIFTAIWPIIEVFLFGGIFKLLRYQDRGWTNDKFSTNLPSV
jgi:hypothetical protein